MNASSAAPSGVDCLRCGAELGPLIAGAAPDCARCWLGVSMSAPKVTVGGYELILQLGEGGFGSVHLAREPASDRLVALKLAKPEAEQAQHLLHQETRNASTLAHRHIVRVLASGHTESGQAFLALELMENGTLAEAVALGQYRERREVLSLILKLAHALEYAHRYAVLHCDLKAENILFDAEGEPHVADFGLSQRATKPGSVEPENYGGTLGWMSPEQARQQVPVHAGKREALTVMSDVFSLGVLLHWLLTRKLPFGSGPDFAQRVQFEPAPAPVPTRRWARDLDWELSLLCTRALHKKPQERYRSAAEFGDDVERTLQGLPLSAERNMPLRRLAKWVRRHKLLALAAGLLVCILVYLPLVPFLVLDESRKVVIEQNSNASLHQAGAFMNELRAFADHLQDVAADEDVQALVEYADLSTPPPALLRYAAGDIQNLIVFSQDGTLRARWPRAEKIPPTFNFAFRDYFQGAMRMGQQGLHQVYVARSIRSLISDQIEMELSVPMFGKQGDFVGIFAGSRQVRSTFGAVQMNCARAGSCITELLGPRDRDAAGAPLPSALGVIAAPGLEPGAEISWDLALGRKICERLSCTPALRDQFQASTNVSPLVEDYLDPVSHLPSIGAFAPVGKTGLVVVVATPHSAVEELTDRMLNQAGSLLGVPVLLGLALFGVLLASLRVYRPALGPMGRER